LSRKVREITVSVNNEHNLILIEDRLFHDDIEDHEGITNSDMIDACLMVYHGDGKELEGQLDDVDVYDWTMVQWLKTELNDTDNEIKSISDIGF